MLNPKRYLNKSSGPDSPASKDPVAVLNLTVMMDLVFSLPKMSAPVLQLTQTGKAVNQNGNSSFSRFNEDLIFSSSDELSPLVSLFGILDVRAVGSSGVSSEVRVSLSFPCSSGTLIPAAFVKWLTMLS